jgi:IS5 family transposase
MPHQASFADLDHATKKRRTRREVFLGEMDSVVPWSVLVARLEPY